MSGRGVDSLIRNGLIYLASPYSHPSEDVRGRRFFRVCKAAAELMRREYLIFSPIAHTHPISKHGLQGDWARTGWKRYGQAMLAVCDELAVLQLDGWQESTGVQAEIKIADDLGKPITYIDPAELGVPAK